MNVLVLHGPNLSLLGERPGDPPHPTLAEINAELQERAAELGISLHLLQSNHEGVLVDALHEQRQWFDGVILNPAALTATSYALRDAISAVQKPVFEVHLEDLRKMEPWKRKSVLKEVCEGQVAGKGVGSYVLALERMAQARQKSVGRGGKKARSSGSETPTPAAPLASKTLGRRPAVASAEAPAPKTQALGKTLGKAPLSVSSRVAQLGFLTRALVRQKIAERLSGKLSAAGLATWARSQWNEVQRGAPAESGQRELLEELLQSLFLSTSSAQPLTDDQLIERMTRLDR